ncbi:MAG: hypothetical protein IJV05_06765 [Muribaculaceae bacterium]|nr:hypothetical protein [Muribaculaceae bacterium]
MNKPFLLFIAALALCLALAACSDKDDEPGITPAPEILSELTEQTVIVKAQGLGRVRLYYGGDEEVANPTSLSRDFVNYTAHFKATAQQHGKSVSKVAEKEILVPKTDDPLIMTAFSVVESENDSTFFEFDINRVQPPSRIIVRKARLSDSGPELPSFYVTPALTFDKGTGIFTFSGTDITPSVRTGGSYVSQPDSKVTDLDCTVNIKTLTYSIQFDYQGKHFDYSGSISKTYPVRIIIHG